MQLDMFGVPPRERRTRERRQPLHSPAVVAINEGGRRIGESHHNAALTDAEVGMLLDLREREGWSYTRLARTFEIAKATARDYIKGRRRCQTIAGHRVVCARGA